jgi:hypothetical protein
MRGDLLLRTCSHFTAMPVPPHRAKISSSADAAKRPVQGTVASGNGFAIGGEGMRGVAGDIGPPDLAGWYFILPPSNI